MPLPPLVTSLSEKTLRSALTLTAVSFSTLVPSKRRPDTRAPVASG